MPTDRQILCWSPAPAGGSLEGRAGLSKPGSAGALNLKWASNVSEFFNEDCWRNHLQAPDNSAALIIPLQSSVRPCRYQERAFGPLD